MDDVTGRIMSFSQLHSTTQKHNQHVIAVSINHERGFMLQTSTEADVTAGIHVHSATICAHTAGPYQN